MYRARHLNDVQSPLPLRKKPISTLMAKSATTNHESSGFDQHSVATPRRLVKRAHSAPGFGGETSRACKRLWLAGSIRNTHGLSLSEHVSKDSLHSGMLLQASPSLTRNLVVRSEALSWEFSWRKAPQRTMKVPASISTPWLRLGDLSKERTVRLDLEGRRISPPSLPIVDPKPRCKE